MRRILISLASMIALSLSMSACAAPEENDGANAANEVTVDVNVDGTVTPKDAMVDYWYAVSGRTWEYISKYEFYAHPFEQLLIIDHLGNKRRLLDGWCANQLWNNNRRTTWYDAYRKCAIVYYY
jgi:hypothetical protein